MGWHRRRGAVVAPSVANLGKHRGDMKAVAAAYRAQKGAGQVGGALPQQEEGEDDDEYALRVQETRQTRSATSLDQPSLNLRSRSQNCPAEIVQRLHPRHRQLVA
jgi:hypothetical protein